VGAADAVVVVGTFVVIVVAAAGGGGGSGGAAGAGTGFLRGAVEAVDPPGLVFPIDNDRLLLGKVVVAVPAATATVVR
jgi:hypothetical protein